MLICVPVPGTYLVSVPIITAEAEFGSGTLETRSRPKKSQLSKTAKAFVEWFCSFVICFRETVYAVFSGI